MAANAPQATWAQVEKAAVSFRGLLVWFGLTYLANILASIFQESPLVIPFVLLSLAATVVMLIYVYRLAVAVGWSVPWLWVILMFFPCVNIIVLLVLNQRATQWMKECGVSVGLLGPSPASIAEVKSKAEAERVAKRKAQAERAAKRKAEEAGQAESDDAPPQM